MASFDVVAILKNETWNLKEWLDHYIWQGARRFYICDNGSTDNPMKILLPYMELGILEYKYEIRKPFQINWYIDALTTIQESEDPPDWVLHADLDEFWYSSEGTLSEVLTSYSPTIDVISTPWKVYGPVKESKFHPQSLRKECVYRIPNLGSPKYIFRTFSINPLQIEVHNIKGFNQKGMITDMNRIHCNHYVGQSYNYWQQVKMPRGYVMTTDLPNETFNPYTEEVYTKNLEDSIVLDTELRDLLEAKEKATHQSRNADLRQDAHGQDDHARCGTE